MSSLHRFRSCARQVALECLHAGTPGTFFPCYIDALCILHPLPFNGTYLKSTKSHPPRACNMTGKKDQDLEMQPLTEGSVCSDAEDDSRSSFQFARSASLRESHTSTEQGNVSRSRSSVHPLRMPGSPGVPRLMIRRSQSS